MRPILKFLVVGVSVNGGEGSFLYVKIGKNYFNYWGDAIGGAGCVVSDRVCAVVLIDAKYMCPDAFSLGGS